MAHFAQIDENNIVLQVIVVNNNTINNLQFPESEPIGIEFCRSLYGQDTNWLQTSYNSTFRKRFAASGYTYNAQGDAFVKPKPSLFDYFVLDSNYEWVPPVPMPDDNWVFGWGKFEIDENGNMIDLTKVMLDQGITDPNLLWSRVPQPYPSWTPSSNRIYWVPPVQCPIDDKAYKWDEDTQSWIEFVPAQV